MTSTPSPFTPSPARRGLDWLLETHPHLDLVSLDWQVEPDDGRSVAHWRGPWLLVELGQPSEQIEIEPAWAIWRFAIFRRTGAVHPIDHDGAASDDPIYVPGEEPR
jgi:hypothetical protein